MDSTIDFGRSDFQISRIFICRGCKLRINPPVRQCRRGHLICRKCFLRAKCCPSCKGSLDRERNFTIDSLARIIRFPCSYAEYGCGAPSMPSKERVPHESHCPHRPFSCFVRGCKWVENTRSERPSDPSTVAVLSDHIQAQHPKYLPYSQGRTLSLKLNPSEEAVALKESEESESEAPNKMYVLSEGGKLFLAKVHLQKCFGEVFLVVSVTGLARPTEEAPDHHYSVHVRGGDCEMSHKAPVLSYMLSRGESEGGHWGLDSYQGVIYSGKYTTKGGDLYLDFCVMTAQQAREKKLDDTSNRETNERMQHLD